MRLANLKSHEEAGGESDQAGTELCQHALHPLAGAATSLFDPYGDLLPVDGNPALLGQKVEPDEHQSQHEEGDFGGPFGRVTDGDAGDCAAADLS